jgi:hypothetical protein
MYDVAKPDYTIWQFTDEIYKVVRFKRSGYDGPPSLLKLHKDLQETNDTKLDNNYSRAKSKVLQYALCNPWTWFFTGTLDKGKYDRHDLQKYHDDLSQFIRDQRKKHKAKIQYLLVPEAHKDGAWHMHGLIHNLPESAIEVFTLDKHPAKVVKGGYKNWVDYSEKFGFCSLGRIKHPVATAFYVSKYVSKDVSKRAGDMGKHLHFASRPLRSASAVSDVYGSCSELDSKLTWHGDFCSTGMVKDEDWTFAVRFDENIPFNLPQTEQLQPEKGFHPSKLTPEYLQLNFDQKWW